MIFSIDRAFLPILCMYVLGKYKIVLSFFLFFEKK
jgi:hypothetical protein